MKKALYILIGIVGTIVVSVLTLLLSVFLAGIAVGLSETESLSTLVLVILGAAPFVSGIFFAVKWHKKMKATDFSKEPAPSAEE